MFRKNMAYARNLSATAIALARQVTTAINTDDLLRASLVQGVSAFDHFIHEEVCARMILTQQGSHPMAKGYVRFRVSLDSVNQALAGSGVSWLESEIREQHGYLSFQNPDKVADALRLVTDASVWPAVGGHLNRKHEDLKRQLKLIVDRRNKIAHEADTDPTPPRTRYPIEEPMVRQSLDFLEQLAEAIIAVT
ncbi:hypothetical protein [Micromonospora sp. NPDC048839]|uniref:hypothetical protein n=1 Tax=Micromonospora sp. NPDC048839 TaxID=3155641 RepID=UPI0033F5B5E2